MQDFADVPAKVSSVLPTGTFLVFRVLAPSATNNGDCGVTEKVVTSIVLVVLSAFCCVSCFTDSYRDESGLLRFGVVTSEGLWNPTFSNAHGTQGSSHRHDNRYKRRYSDFFNAGISVAAFATFTLLTAPVTTCFYPHIAGSIVKTVPLLVGLLISAICSFTDFRRGMGFALSTAPAPPGPAALAPPGTPPAVPTAPGLPPPGPATSGAPPPGPAAHAAPSGSDNPTASQGSGNSAAA